MVLKENKVLSSITAIIVDDELHGGENLKKIIETYCSEVEILACADSVVQAKNLVKIHNPDVIFLDINMPVLDGFDFLKEFDERNFMMVIFSAHDEYGIQAVKAGVVDYLLKPVNIKELKLTIKKLLFLKNKQVKMEILPDTYKIVLPVSHGFEVIEFDEIIRLEADGPYTRVILGNHKYKLVSHTLKDFEDTLPGEKFYRIHKSHLINLKCIKAYSNISGNYVTMTEASRSCASGYYQKGCRKNKC